MFDYAGQRQGGHARTGKKRSRKERQGRKGQDQKVNEGRGTEIKSRTANKTERANRFEDRLNRKQLTHEENERAQEEMKETRGSVK